MTPDDMEAVVSEWLALASDVWPRCVPVSEGEIDAIRALLLDYQERGRALREAAEYLCRLEGALLADDLDMRLNFPDEPSPTAMAERILPGFDSIEFDLARATLKGKSHD
jgi:hypothetical protein